MMTTSIQPRLSNTEEAKKFLLLDISNSAGAIPNVLIIWALNSDYKSMKPYIKVVDKFIKKKMTKFLNLKFQQ